MVDTADLLKVAISRAWACAWLPNLMALVESVSEVPGCIVECGSYKGGTAMAMALAAPHKTVYAFDTFAGMPEVTAEDQHKAGDFGDACYYETLEAMKPFGNLVPVRGEFKDTFPTFNQPIAALFLDCDLYESYKLAFQWMWPLISPGGICILEDYGVLDCKGATKAIEEFFEPRQIELREDLYVVQR